MPTKALFSPFEEVIFKGVLTYTPVIFRNYLKINELVNFRLSAIL